MSIIGKLVVLRRAVLALIKVNKLFPHVLMVLIALDGMNSLLSFPLPLKLHLFGVHGLITLLLWLLNSRADFLLYLSERLFPDCFFLILLRCLLRTRRFSNRFGLLSLERVHGKYLVHGKLHHVLHHPG